MRYCLLNYVFKLCLYLFPIFIIFIIYITNNLFLFLYIDALMRTDYQLFYPGTLGPLHISTTSGNTSAPSWNPSFYSSLYQATTLHLHHGMQSFT